MHIRERQERVNHDSLQPDNRQVCKYSRHKTVYSGQYNKLCLDYYVRDRIPMFIPLDSIEEFFQFVVICPWKYVNHLQVQHWTVAKHVLYYVLEVCHASKSIYIWIWFDAVIIKIAIDLLSIMLLYTHLNALGCA